MEQEKTTEQGVIKWFSQEKGYGFIIPDDKQKDLFFHKSNISSLDQTLEDNMRVEFEIVDGKKGPEAVNIKAI